MYSRPALRALGQRLLQRNAQLLGARGHVAEHALAQERARTHVVDEYAVAADFIRETFGECHHARARSTREREVGYRLIHGAGEYVDDASALLLFQVRDGFPRHARKVEERALHGGGPLFLRCAEGFRERRPAGIIHQYVELPVFLYGSSDQRLYGGVLLEIAGKCKNVGAGLLAYLLRGALEVGGGAAAHDDPRAFAGEHFRARAAEALARAADDSHLAFQFQIHGRSPSR